MIDNMNEDAPKISYTDLVKNLLLKIEELEAGQSKINERLTGMGKLMIDHKNSLSSQMLTLSENVFDLQSKKIDVPRYTIHKHQSDDIGQLSLAFSKAFAAIEIATTNAAAHRNKYVDIDEINELIRIPLKENELSYDIGLNENEYGEFILIQTLAHSSGQWRQNICRIHDEQSSSTLPFHQRIGAAEKYMRRYMMRSLFNIGGKDE